MATPQQRIDALAASFSPTAAQAAAFLSPQEQMNLLIVALSAINQTIENAANPIAGGIMVTIGDGVNAIDAGTFCYLTMPFAAEITGWKILADASGSIVVDVKKSTFAAFPTTAGIAGSELPTLSSAQTNEDSTLTTWTTTLSASDVLHFVVNSASTVKKVFMLITIDKL